jgi:L-iditol 2-dehydrogenase
MRTQVLVRPGRLELHDLPIPEPGPGEVVLRIRSALTCGTDVKALQRGHPKFPMPTPFGHEFSGEVVAVGEGVRSVRSGDAVMATPTAPCKRCYYCEHQQENLCDSVMETMVLGAYSEYVKLPARVVSTNLFVKPPRLSFAVAALLEPLSCVLHGIDSVALRKDDSVVLIGAGAISLLHLLALRAMGLEEIRVIGRSAQRAEYARRLGARAVVVGDMAAAQENIREATGGRGADLVIECTGQPQIWEAAPGLARRGGNVVLFGGCPPGTEVRFDTQRLHYEQLRVISPFHFTPRAVRRAYEVLNQEDFNGQALITAVHSLEELPEALAAHQRGEGIKFEIRP